MGGGSTDTYNPFKNILLDPIGEFGPSRNLFTQRASHRNSLDQEVSRISDSVKRDLVEKNNKDNDGSYDSLS